MKLDNLSNLNCNLTAEDESKNIPDPRGVISRNFSASKKKLVINMSI